MKLNYKLLLLTLLSCKSSQVLNLGTRENFMTKKNVLKVVGWREWISLPDLKISDMKVKVDTGARTSSLHAFEIESYEKGGKEYVKFKVHPDQRSTKKTAQCHAEVLEYRKIKSSNGQSELRPVILTTAELLGERWSIELTLTSRDEMGFRMLLGRSSFKNRFLVNVGKSFNTKKNKQKGSL